MEPQPRFNLDQAVAAWRAELASHPGPAPEDLRTLEAHLRDGIAALQGGQLSDEEAFLIAQHRVGQAPAVAGEFAKTVTPSHAFRRCICGLAFLGIFGVFVYYGINSTPMYRATATIVGPFINGQLPTAQNAIDEAGFNSRVKLMEANAVTDAVHMVLMMTPPGSSSDALQEHMLKQSTIIPNRSTYTIQVNVDLLNRESAKIAAYQIAKAMVENQDRSNAVQKRLGLSPSNENYRVLDTARDSVQIAPKIWQVVLGGFVSGLAVAFVVNVLMRLLSRPRPKSPPAMQVS